MATSRGPRSVYHRATRLLYDLLWLVFLAGWTGYLVLRRPAGWRQEWLERMGLAPIRPDGAATSIWIHAVSVGELLSIVPVVLAIKRRDPFAWIVVTVSNERAFALRHKIPADAVCWTPWDGRWMIGRFLRRARPEVLAIVECEIWPNMILGAAEAGRRVVMINARIYARDFPRYRAAGFVFRPVLARVDSIHVQSPSDRQRFRRLGVPDRKLFDGGNTKFDCDQPTESLAIADALRRSWRLDGRPVWILASTHEGEEAAILGRCEPIFRRWPQTRLLIAPRDVTRAQSLLSLARALGYRARLRSRELGDAEASIVILDTMGELAGLFSIANVVFVGGSLVPKGGHNPIEPALFAKPILMGPHYFNFPEVVSEFLLADAMRVVTDAKELVEEVTAVLADPEGSRAMGRRAAEVVQKHRGAADRYAELLCASARRAAA